MATTKILYGECIGSRQTAEVRISDLADGGCDLEIDGPDAIDGDVALWIGAVGPIDAVAIPRDASHVALRFKQPLDDRIVEHFAMS